MGNINRIRTIQQLHEMLLEDDPGTAITEYAIRRIVYDGLIPSVPSGNKRLASYENLCKYLNGGN